MSTNENVLKGAGYKAKVKFYTCKGSGECIKVCPEKAISEGPSECLPQFVFLLESTRCYPGKLSSMKLNVPAVENAFLFVLKMQLKW